MSAVVQARCPYCKNVLRIPAEWVAQPMRCKFCHNIFQARGSAPAPAPVARPAVPVARKAAAPVAAPATAVTANPFSIQHAVINPNASPYRPRYRKGGRGGWWGGILVCGGALALAAIVVVALGPQLSGLFDHHKPTEQAKEDGKETPKTDDAKGPNDPNSQQGPANGNTPKTDPMEKKDPPKTDPMEKKDPPKMDPMNPMKDPPKKDPIGPKDPPKTDPMKDPPKTDPMNPKKDPPKTDPMNPKKDPPKKDPEIVKDPPKKNPPKEAPFPRRALLVGVSEYLFANPLHPGNSPQNPRDAFPGSNLASLRDQLARGLHFPARQVFELNDRAVQKPFPPLKASIESTVTEFLKTTREQDRILLLFTGHAVEIDKEAYLVPLEGDLTDAATLIKLSWLYDQLRACKARQKVLVLDICRHNQGAGSLRPGSGELTEGFDARLRELPAGVQVLVACDVKQESLEFESGSLFLQAFTAAVKSILTQPSGIMEASSPIPMDLLTGRVNAFMERTLTPFKLKQTARLFGKEPENGAGPNPDEEPPALLAIETSPIGPMGQPAAGADLVRRILDELNQIPPVRGARAARDDLKVSNLPPFPANVMEQYQADASAPELKKAILDAVQAMNESSNIRFDEAFFGASTAQVKKQVFDKQGPPGRAAFALESALEDLKAAGEAHLEKETSKRWKANYYFVLAKLESRLVYLMEYNYLLAQIRTDSLPSLEGGFAGYRMASKAKVSIPEGKVKDWVKEVRRTWDTIAKEFPNTPYSILARRERMTVLGLEWRPTRR